MMDNIHSEVIEHFKAGTEKMLAVLNTLQSLDRDNQCAMICGSWLASHSNRALLIRKNPMSFVALICDTSKCYKIVERKFTVEARRGKLFIRDEHGQLTGETVRYNPEQNLIEFGNYGIFRSEEYMLIEHWQNQVEIFE